MRDTVVEGSDQVRPPGVLTCADITRNRGTFCISPPSKCNKLGSTLSSRLTAKLSVLFSKLKTVICHITVHLAWQATPLCMQRSCSPRVLLWNIGSHKASKMKAGANPDDSFETDTKYNMPTQYLLTQPVSFNLGSNAAWTTYALTYFVTETRLSEQTTLKCIRQTASPYEMPFVANLHDSYPKAEIVALF